MEASALRYIQVIKIILGFMILSLYNNLLPIMLGLNGATWLVIPLFFFFILYGIARFTSKSFRDFGLQFHSGWVKNLIKGFSFGFIFYCILVSLSIFFERYQFHESRTFGEIALLIVSSLIGMFFGSLLNDIITKGYIYGSFKEIMSRRWLILLILFSYSFDDIWYEGFSISNTVFSICLGLSLVYCLFQTRSIWMTTGIHWGWNVMYSLFYGMPGTGEQGGIYAISIVNRGAFFQYLTLVICIMMFLFVVCYFSFKKKQDVSFSNTLSDK